jgi:hypothetical protein
MRCRQEIITPGKVWTEQNRIDLNPVYQREAGVWSDEKRKLFIDSLLNGYDVPKIYLNAFPPGEPFLWAVIDGKQRLTTMISFMNNDFPLAEDFVYSGESIANGQEPRASQHFRDFTESAKEVFKVINLSTTVTDSASEEEIENLFARLNNGEALNSAEQRNAIGGEMNELVRDLADRPFFINKCSFARNRYAHREVSCKLLLIEMSRLNNGNSNIPQLKKKFLDALVKDNRSMPERLRTQLTTAVESRLRKLEKLFDNESPELRKQSYPQFFYLWNEFVTQSYGHSRLIALMKTFIPEFTLMRERNNQIPREEDRDPVLVEFGRLTQQGTNDSGALERRVEIMTRYFLGANPEIRILDSRRAFSELERYVIWLKAGKQCEGCTRSLVSLDDVDADHETMWAHGGPTTFENARALCQVCNRGRRPVSN